MVFIGAFGGIFIPARESEAFQVLGNAKTFFEKGFAFEPPTCCFP